MGRARCGSSAAAWRARRLAAQAALDQAGLLANPTASLAFEDFGLNGAAAQSMLQTTLSLAFSLEDVFAQLAVQEDTEKVAAELDAVIGG